MQPFIFWEKHLLDAGEVSASLSQFCSCWLNTEAEYMGISHREEVLFEMHLSEAIKKFLAIFLAL